MSGPLVGKVLRRGPQNTTDRMVCVVLAEHIHNEDSPNVDDLYVDDLADRACLSRRAVHTALRRLEAAGWITISSGRGRHSRSRYRLNVELLSTPSKKVHEVHTFDSQKGAADAPIRIEKGAADVEKGAAGAHVLPSVKTSSSSVTLETAAEPAAWEADDDELKVALTGLPAVPWSDEIRAALGDVLVERGHTAAAVNRYLLANVRTDGSVRTPGRLVAKLLREIPPASSTSSTTTRSTTDGPTCRECGLVESACQKIPAAVSGHSFTRRGTPQPPPETNRASTGLEVAEPRRDPDVADLVDDIANGLTIERDDDPWAKVRARSRAASGGLRRHA